MGKTFFLLLYSCRLLLLAVILLPQILSSQLLFLGGRHSFAFAFLSLVIVCCNSITGFPSSKLPNIMSNLTLSIAVLREDIFLLAYSYRLLLLAVIVLLATLVLNYQTSCQILRSRLLC